MDDLTSFTRLIAALRPWLGDLVIVGGWAHQLRRLHPLNPPSYQPLRTMNAALAFSPEAPMVGDIGAALKAADFQEKFMGEHTPPVIHYRLGDEDQGFYVEFLAPLLRARPQEERGVECHCRQGWYHGPEAAALGSAAHAPLGRPARHCVDVPLEPPADVRLANPLTSHRSCLSRSTGHPTSRHRMRCASTTRWNCSDASWRL